MIAFDLGGSVPPCSTIVAVDLVLRVVQSPTPSQQAVDLHRLTADWGEAMSQAPGGQGGGGPATPGDATWIHTSFNTQTWTNPGGDFLNVVSGTTMVGGAGSYTWSSAGMVTDVQHWVDNPGQNFGWIVRTIETGTRTARAFATKEEQLNPTFRPQLRITYNPPRASVTSSGAGCAGSGATPLTASTNGNPTIPNANFRLGMTGGPPGVINGYAFALRVANPPLALGGGCFVHIDPLTFLVGAAGDANRSLLLPVPNANALLGAQLVAQGVVADAANLQPVSSNALVLKLGL